MRGALERDQENRRGAAILTVAEDGLDDAVPVAAGGPAGLVVPRHLRRDEGTEIVHGPRLPVHDVLVSRLGFASGVVQQAGEIVARLVGLGVHVVLDFLRQVLDGQESEVADEPGHVGLLPGVDRGASGFGVDGVPARELGVEAVVDGDFLRDFGQDHDDRHRRRVAVGRAVRASLDGNGYLPRDHVPHFPFALDMEPLVELPSVSDRTHGFLRQAEGFLEIRSLIVGALDMLELLHRGRVHGVLRVGVARESHLEQRLGDLRVHPLDDGESDAEHDGVLVARQGLVGLLVPPSLEPSVLLELLGGVGSR